MNVLIKDMNDDINLLTVPVLYGCRYQEQTVIIQKMTEHQIKKENQASSSHSRIGSASLARSDSLGRLIRRNRLMRKVMSLLCTGTPARECKSYVNVL